MKVLSVINCLASLTVLQSGEEPELDPRQEDAIIAAAAARLARRENVRIVVEPSLKLSSRLRDPVNALPIERELDRLASQIIDGTWSRLSVSANAGRPLPSPARLAELGRSIARSQAGCVIENPSRGRALGITASSTHRKAAPGSETVYLLFRSRLREADLHGEDYSDLIDQQLDLLRSTSPAEAPNPMRGWAEALAELGPEKMKQVVGPMAEAGARLWEDTPLQERSEILSRSMTVAKSYGGGLMAPQPRSVKPRRNYLPELKAVASKISKKHNVRILVDPSLYLGSPPSQTDPMAPVEEALTALLAGDSDLIWRRVHLTRSQTEEADPASLAKNIRLWESIEADCSFVERGAASPRVLISTPDKGHLREMIAALGDDCETAYIILGATDHRSRPKSERLADLLKRQMEQVVRMNPQELSSAMTNAMDTFRNAGTDAERERVMALPIMAGMMATWFPRAAKEGTLPP